MEQMTGIGGFFFRASDFDAPAAWDAEHVGVTGAPKSYDDPVWAQESGAIFFSPFVQDADYVADRDKNWMLNFRMADMNAMIAQSRGAGITVKADPEVQPNGWFARLTGPEGSLVELWQPKPVGGMI